MPWPARVPAGLARVPAGLAKTMTFSRAVNGSIGQQIHPLPIWYPHHFKCPYLSCSTAINDIL